MHPQRRQQAEGGGGIALNDVLIWVLIPALSYLAGALFQAGYNHYFDLPDALVSADPVAIFQAARRYLELIASHFSVAIAIPLAFLIYLTVLPSEFYRRHAILVLVMAAVALLISFSIRPFAWAIVAAAVLVAVQLVAPKNVHVRQLNVTSPVAVKTLAIVAFFYATLFSAGYESARYETLFFVTDHDPRYVMLALNDKDAIAAELLDAHCKRVTSVPSYMQDYHFDQHIRAFTLGDTDTPPFKLYASNGLKPAKACASPDQSGHARGWLSAIWI